MADTTTPSTPGGVQVNAERLVTKLRDRLGEELLQRAILETALEEARSRELALQQFIAQMMPTAKAPTEESAEG